MTDRERDFNEACDYTAPDCRDRASVAMQASSKMRPHGATPNDLSVVAAQLAEAACRVCNGDREAARTHIAQACALLQHTPSLGPTAARVAIIRERVVTDDGLC